MSRPTIERESLCIPKPQLQAIIDHLKSENFRTVGPQVSQGAVVYGDIDSVNQLPIGYLDEQDGGYYRLNQCGEAWFDYVVGPHSLKNFLFPPQETLVQLDRIDGHWQSTVPQPSAQPLAIIGPRSCDLHAMKIQDRVFLGENYADPSYQARRQNLFIVAVNCRRAAATCFCHSVNTGPTCTADYDLVLTELDERFMIDVGTPQGRKVVQALGIAAGSESELAEARQRRERLVQELESRGKSTSQSDPASPPLRSLDTTGIHSLLLGSLDHPQWNEIAQRCLACTNCTLVCPTCFCSSVQEVSDLSGEHVQRERAWDSCFTMEHSQMSSGAVRKSIASRYRQWLTHKLSTWFDQFGTSGCVGCGRCITWCPVGIDLTEEVAAIREGAQ